jgi:hypothetical protein
LPELFADLINQLIVASTGSVCVSLKLTVELVGLKTSVIGEVVVNCNVVQLSVDISEFVNPVFLTWAAI